MKESARKPVNKGQLSVLMLLYRYRFITADRLALVERQRNVAVSRSRLTILCEQGYVGRHYDSSYKLLGKSARYYLLPRGLAALKTNADLQSKAIKAAYNDKTASDTFVDTCLRIFDISMKYQEIYRSEAQVFTRAELAAYSYFPQPTPDLYVSVQGDQPAHYFIDYYPKEMQLFVMLRRVKKYIAYSESGLWNDTGSAFPCVVIICSSSTSEEKLRTRITPLLVNLEAEVRIATISTSELFATASSTVKYRDVML